MINAVMAGIDAYSAAAACAEPRASRVAGRRGRSQRRIPEARVGDYAGRVSTFYSAVQDRYSETYEPVRKTNLGEIWRVESKLVAGRWLHIAYSLTGIALPGPESAGGIISDGELALMFDPQAEKEFAMDVLASRPQRQFIRLAEDVTVYRSSKDLSVGVVREHVGKR